MAAPRSAAPQMQWAPAKMNTTIQVELPPHSYPIHIGPGLLNTDGPLAERVSGGRVLVVSNDTVAALHGERLRSALSSAEHVGECILPDGERWKNLETLAHIFDAAIDHGCGRDCWFVALGGGVIGDMAGFAAACWQRGVRLIQVPTTLLAQVDSSVGGKTGVNHPRGKNMIGAFHQPRAVVADTDTLHTLDDRQFHAGLAEVIKYGLIRDAAFFDWIETELDAVLAREPAALAHVIEQSCRNKAAVVAADERETGVRALLNLGHTFGHAIETATGYESWLHGEAIAAGMCMAARLSTRIGWLAEAERERVEALFERVPLPTHPPAVGAARMRELMQADKKTLGGRLRLILLEAIGRAVIADSCPAAELDAELVSADPRSRPDTNHA
jgi:3-dehydroquinate synthase